jgi:hypothetical protein
MHPQQHHIIPSYRAKTQTGKLSTWSACKEFRTCKCQDFSKMDQASQCLRHTNQLIFSDNGVTYSSCSSRCILLKAITNSIPGDKLKCVQIQLLRDCWHWYLLLQFSCHPFGYRCELLCRMATSWRCENSPQSIKDLLDNPLSTVVTIPGRAFCADCVGIRSIWSTTSHSDGLMDSVHIATQSRLITISTLFSVSCARCCAFAWDQLFHF